MVGQWNYYSNSFHHIVCLCSFLKQLGLRRISWNLNKADFNMLKVICKPSVCAWHAARCSFLLLDLKRSETVHHILNTPSQVIIPLKRKEISARNYSMIMQLRKTHHVNLQTAVSISLNQ